MRFLVIIDQGYGYSIDASNVRVAIARAMMQHDRVAKERHAAGHLTPLSMAEMARKRGIRIYSQREREATDEAPKRRRSASRSLLLTRA